MWRGISSRWIAGRFGRAGREMGRLAAFLQRDWRLRSSYRFHLTATLAHVFFTVASFFFIGKLVDPRGSPALEPYGGAYFPFVIVGLAFSQYLAMSLSTFGGIIRDEQLQGTLEAMLLTPTRLVTIVLGGVIWDFLWTSVEVGVYLGVGAACFGLDLGRMNIPASLVVLALTILLVSSLGVLSGCGILLFKEFDPVSWLLGGMMRLVGGVYFPVTLLPGVLQPLAQAVPLTHALEGLRQAMLLGRSLRELGGICAVLGVFTLVFWPLALLSFAWTIRRLKTTGAMSFR